MTITIDNVFGFFLTCLCFAFVCMFWYAATELPWLPLRVAAWSMFFGGSATVLYMLVSTIADVARGRR